MDNAPSPEAVVRVTVFAGVFLVIAVVETLQPWRPSLRRERWTANLLLFAIGAVALRLVFPAAAVGLALFANARGWGLLPALGLPAPVAATLAFIGLDAIIWAQHRLFHHVPWLWRLHRVHHTDTALDLTTGLRFHPLEILFSMLIKAAAVVALGAPAVAVLAFEIALSSTALFNHANLRLPAALDRALRLVLVTPAMHRVHHSWHGEETNSNFGFNLPWWDRAFGTYTAESRDGPTSLTIGLREFREPAAGRCLALLLQPFRTPTQTVNA